jgi:putative transposase
VKHGYVSRVAEWPYSTFHRFVRAGFYPPDWGGHPALESATGFGK